MSKFNLKQFLCENRLTPNSSQKVITEIRFLTPKVHLDLTSGQLSSSSKGLNESKILTFNKEEELVDTLKSSVDSVDKVENYIKEVSEKYPHLIQNKT